jgi:catechol 2,3-dioxygenase-like lactoylglutathione lyase family enzyme
MSGARGNGPSWAGYLDIKISGVDHHAMRLHHVQVACPPGGEDAARRFYADGLGLAEVAKPPALAGRGGCWFRSLVRDGSGGVVVAAEIHVGVEEPFSPARKAHPALVVDDAEELDALSDRLEALGFDVDRTERETFDGHLRFHTVDGAGNRVEVLAPIT